jgi:hypothetical protein
VLYSVRFRMMCALGKVTSQLLVISSAREVGTALSRTPIPRVVGRGKVAYGDI